MSMHRRLMSLVIVAIVVCLTTSVALAGMRITSLHFSTVEGGATLMASGPSTLLAESDTDESCEVSGTCEGLQLQAALTLVGIGKAGETTNITIDATGTPVVVCTNQGGQAAPGQNPSQITTSGQKQLEETDITRNGRADISVMTALPPDNLPGELWGCPNGTWTAKITLIQFESATITVFQDGEPQVFGPFDLAQ